MIPDEQFPYSRLNLSTMTGPYNGDGEPRVIKYEGLLIVNPN